MPLTKNNIISTPFSQVENGVLHSSDLTVHQKLVYAVLVSYADNKTHSCYPAYSTIAQRVGCCRSTAIKAVTALEKKGYIAKNLQLNGKNEYHTNFYTIIFDANVANTPPSITNTPPSIATAPPSITNTPPSVADTPNLYQYNHTIYNDTYSSSSSNGHEDVFENVHSSSHLDQDGLIEGVNDKIKEQIDYPFLVENFSDKQAIINIVLSALVAHSSTPRYAYYISCVTSDTVISFFSHITTLDLSKVVHMDKYLTAVFLQYIVNYEVAISSLP